jgi:hypothetical protein
MDSAKKLAREMLGAIKVDESGFIEGVAKGIISIPVSISYLGYDFFDTDNRHHNFDDKVRLANLIKKITFNSEVVEKMIRPFIDDFVSRIDLDKLKHISAEIGGSLVGKTIFSQITGINLGRMIVARGVASFISGAVVGSILGIGAEASRAIYTSRYLRERNSAMYYKLRNMGDYDLLYFLVKDIVRPYEEACEVSKVNALKFEQICIFFLGGL